MARTISSRISGPVVLGSTDDPLTITRTGAIASTGAADGIDGSSAVAWTIANDGTIVSYNELGISLGGGGIVNNGTVSGSSAYIRGDRIGVVISGGPGTVINSGKIVGAGYFGITFAAGGSVTNAAGASIIGASFDWGATGVIIQGGSGTGGTVTNSGSITGIRIQTFGSVTNNAGARITNGVSI
jgi:hypothetical protein